MKLFKAILTKTKYIKKVFTNRKHLFVKLGLAFTVT